jgi:hypothetical protein
VPRFVSKLRAMEKVKKTRLSRSLIGKDPRRPEIERALALGVPMQQVGRKYGYTIGAIKRHRDNMPAQLKAAIIAATLKPKEGDLDRLRIDESEGILGGLAGQRARLLLLQDQAIEVGAVDTANRLSNTIHRNIELVGRYLGQFASHHVSTKVSILISEDYLRVRQAITEALRPHREARLAVSAALQTIENGIAQRSLIEAGKAPATPMITVEALP